MPEFFQKLHEQYRTEYYGPWHTRECYPWEYDTKIQELIQLANTPSRSWCDTEESNEWLRQQAKIFQNRADYIRQKWAKQEAEKQARKEADERFNQLLATMRAWQATQQSTPPAPQEAKKEEAQEEITAEEQEQEPRQHPRYQATVEDAEEDAESSEEKQTEQQYGSSKLSSSKPDSKIALSAIPRVYDPAASLTNALLSAYQHAMNLVGTQFSYIRYMEGMEASGQG